MIVQRWIQKVTTRVVKNYLLIIDRNYKMGFKGILANHFSTKSPNLFMHLSERGTNLFNLAW